LLVLLLADDLVACAAAALTAMLPLPLTGCLLCECRSFAGGVLVHRKLQDVHFASFGRDFEVSADRQRSGEVAQAEDLRGGLPGEVVALLRRMRLESAADGDAGTVDDFACFLDMDRESPWLPDTEPPPAEAGAEPTVTAAYVRNYSSFPPQLFKRSFAQLLSLRLDCTQLQQLPDEISSLVCLRVLAITVDAEGLRQPQEQPPQQEEPQQPPEQQEVQQPQQAEQQQEQPQQEEQEVQQPQQEEQQQQQQQQEQEVQQPQQEEKHQEQPQLQPAPQLAGSLSALTSLRILHIRGWAALEQLPDMSALTELMELALSGCSGLQSLPPSLSCLAQLQDLHIDGASRLQELPEQLGGLAALRYLELLGCSSLRVLPESIGRLQQLQGLDLMGCRALQALPLSLAALTGLAELRVPAGLASALAVQALAAAGVHVLS
jgi:hypothetical protein